MLKFFLLLLTLIPTSFPDCLSGEYIIKFEENYSHYNGIIKIEKNHYMLTNNGDKISHGTVTCINSKQSFSDSGGKFKIEVYTEDIGKDTIHFRTSKIEEISQEGDIIIFSGRMIKVK